MLSLVLYPYVYLFPEMLFSSTGVHGSRPYPGDRTRYGFGKSPCRWHVLQWPWGQPRIDGNLADFGTVNFSVPLLSPPGFTSGSVLPMPQPRAFSFSARIRRIADPRSVFRKQQRYGNASSLKHSNGAALTLCFAERFV